MYILTLVLLFSLFSCSKTETDFEPSSAETSGVLSNLYTTTSCNVPDDYQLIEGVIPYYDKENGTVTVFSKREETQTGDGVIKEIRTYWLDTLTLSGEVIATEQVPIINDLFSIIFGAITNDSLIYRGRSRTYGTDATYRLDRTTGETISTEESTALYEEEGFSVFFAAADDEGRFYYTDKYTVFVLNPDLSLAFSLDFPAAVYTMARGGDGAVWVTFNTGLSYAAKIDPQTQKLGQYYTFTRGNDTLDGTQHYLLDTAMTDAADAFGYDFYYCDKDTVWGVRAGEDGSLTEETLIDLVNSGIGELYSGYGYGSNVYGVAFLTDEYLMTMKLLSGHSALGGRQHSVPVLCCKSEDIALDSIQTVTIAHAYALDTMTIKQITSFNRENPDIRVVTLDYSVYATEENSLAGEEKLCFDLVNGFIEPDIVVTTADISAISDNMVISQLYKNNLYIDLVPYLENDDTINFDTLFGCIPRLFDDGKGGMWGISTNFQFNTLIGDSQRLSEYTEKGYWTLDEMLDYFDSFPENSEKVYQYNLIQAKWTFFAEGYSYFMKDGECSFTSEEFLRFLDFLVTLPKNRAEWRQMSPCPEIATTYNSVKRQEAIGIAFETGILALDSYGIYSFDFLNLLRSEKFYPIGYATQNTSGMRVSADHAYSITIYADNPDLCFEIIKHFFDGVIFEKIYETEWPFFALKPQYEKAIEVVIAPKEYEIILSDEELAEYGIYRDASTYKPKTALTEEEFAKLYELLDNAGSPLLSRTPTAVQEIVGEEISAYLAGMGTAEECANKIQSRVEIWIAEHE